MADSMNDLVKNVLHGIKKQWRAVIYIKIAETRNSTRIRLFIVR